MSTVGIHLAMLREAWEGAGGPLAQRSLRTLRLVQQEIQRLDEILEDFLRYARTDRLDLQRTDPVALAERVVDFLSPECEARGVRLKVFPNGDIPPLVADPGRLRQALLNLVINARQALDREGEIHVLLRREGSALVLEVVDDGPGMDPDTLARCLDVYMSTKKNGTGLGLPTVARIVEAHGGELQIESEPGHGTRVRITLPLGGPPGHGAAAGGE